MFSDLPRSRYKAPISIAIIEQTTFCIDPRRGIGRSSRVFTIGHGRAGNSKPTKGERELHSCFRPSSRAKYLSSSIEGSVGIWLPRVLLDMLDKAIARELQVPTRYPWKYALWKRVKKFAIRDELKSRIVFNQGLVERGILSAPLHPIWYISASHSKQDIDKIVWAIGESLKESRKV